MEKAVTDDTNKEGNELANVYANLTEYVYATIKEVVPEKKVAQKEWESSIESHKRTLRTESEGIQTRGANARTEENMEYADQRRMQNGLSKLGSDVGRND